MNLNLNAEWASGPVSLNWRHAKSMMLIMFWHYNAEPENCRRTPIPSHLKAWVTFKTWKYAYETQISSYFPGTGNSSKSLIKRKGWAFTNFSSEVSGKTRVSALYTTQPSAELMPGLYHWQTSRITYLQNPTIYKDNSVFVFPSQVSVSGMAILHKWH